MIQLDCIWSDDSPTPGVFVCVHCNRPTSPKRHYDQPPHRNCPNAPDLIPAAERLAEETGDPTIVSKMAHYAMALGRWTLSGFKTRTAEEVQAIYTTHCLPCEKRDPDADACGICGCNVRTEGAAVRNKIKMVTENCPIEKW